MSVDLNDPSIVSVRDAIATKSNPTSWFLLHYPDRSSHSHLKVFASGPDPVLASFRTHLESTSEQVLFGYGEIESKGLVLVYVSEGVGGVRRARAIVHSRAVASLFPDYSALVTVSTPADLTDAFVREKLGLDRPSRHPTHDYVAEGHQWEGHYGQEPIYRYPNGFTNESAAGHVQRQEQHEAPAPAIVDEPVSLVAPPSAPPTPAPTLPAQSAASQVEQPLPTRDSSLNTPPGPRRLPRPPTSAPVLSAPLNGPPANPSPLQTQAVPVQPQSPSPTVALAPAAHQEQTHSALSPVLEDSNSVNQVQQPSTTQSVSSTSTGPPVQGVSNMSSTRAVSSADFFPEPRARKPSLTARISGALKSSPHSPKQPSSPPAAGAPSPNSPGTSRFKGSSLFGSFGRAKRDSAGTPPHSPKVDEFGREGSDSPPPPPPPPKDGPGYPRQSEGAGLLGHEVLIEQPKDFLPPHNGLTYQSASTSANTSGQSSLHPVISYPDTTQSSSLSPSPSARMVLTEAAQRRVAEENEVMEIFRRDQARFNNGQLNGSQRTDEDEDDVRLPYDDPNHDPDLSNLAETNDVQPKASTMPGGLTAFGTPAVESRQEEVGLGAAPVQPDDIVDGSGQREMEPTGGRSFADDEASRQAARDQEARIAEDERKRAEVERAEHERIENEAQARRAAEEAERLQIEEEARLREAEAQLKAEEEERDRLREEERARQQEEERIRLEEEAREQERLKAEAQAKLEAEEQARETERQRAIEEERRVEEARRERKESLRSALARGKAEGSVMLSGHVTAQTVRSMTWRRRYFQLFPGEVRLFKTESASDSKPIQVIHLGQGSSVSQTYEESQVHGSFKVVSSGPNGDEEFFLFTDTPEDKDAVLEGLALAKQ